MIRRFPKAREIMSHAEAGELGGRLTAGRGRSKEEQARNDGNGPLRGDRTDDTLAPPS